MRSRLPETFWSKAVKSANGCLEWQGSRNNKGYGVFKWERRPVLAHRLSYFAKVDRLAEVWNKDIVVRHACDNRRCVNPEHLEQGTHLDNMQDMRIRNKVLLYFS